MHDSRSSLTVASSSALREFLDSGHAPVPPAAVLEIGCGQGYTASYLASLGYQVTAIDLDPVVIGRAQAATSDVNFLTMNALDIGSFSPGSFMLVVAIDLVHLLDPDQQRLLAALVRQILTPGGIFLVIDRSGLADPIRNAQGLEVKSAGGYTVLVKIDA